MLLAQSWTLSTVALPPVWMEKISLLLGSQCMFAFLMLLTLCGPNLTETEEKLVVCPGARLNAAPLRAKREARKCPNIISLYPFMTCSDREQIDAPNGP